MAFLINADTLGTIILKVLHISAALTVFTIVHCDTAKQWFVLHWSFTLYSPLPPRRSWQGQGEWADGDFNTGYVTSNPGQLGFFYWGKKILNNKKTPSFRQYNKVTKETNTIEKEKKPLPSQVKTGDCFWSIIGAVVRALSHLAPTTVLYKDTIMWEIIPTEGA